MAWAARATMSSIPERPVTSTPDRSITPTNAPRGPNIGAADEEKGEIARAVVVRHANANLDEAQLLAHCRKHLASYKVPKLIIFVEDLPKTSTGKILRRALRETAQST